MTRHVPPVSSYERLPGAGGISPSPSPVPPLQRGGGPRDGSRASATPAPAVAARPPAGPGRHGRGPRGAPADPTPQHGRAHRPHRGAGSRRAWTQRGGSPAGGRAAHASRRSGPLPALARPPNRAARHGTSPARPSSGPRRREGPVFARNAPASDAARALRGTVGFDGAQGTRPPRGLHGHAPPRADFTDCRGDRDSERVRRPRTPPTDWPLHQPLLLPA